ncbi:rhodanese-like domain-containing protein [Flavobacterium silvisoli]|uniref:Rhodanese-like domain-containing protein n=1 Tax=Flavobacterium silvisoli TaxID=2529433 RepID=A0A4Q9Z087_9FLAO|nr:rhodanese-like domain-containing protein [Flavobacterium silvisoli]TBX69615.1 rhodanese-like domain-containing protein [Flavobacterium silvisoli]
MFNLFKSMFSKDDSHLAQLIREGAFLVDVRSPLEFSAEKVPGSVNIPLDQIRNHLDKFKNKKNIVVFCRSGARSGQAKSILEQNGFSNVTNAGSWQTVASLIAK